MIIKKNTKLYDISTVAKKIGLINKNGKPQSHTIRFWEKNFRQLKPLILDGNRRYYSEKEINLLILIKKLLKSEGLTIRGVKKILDNKPITLDDDKSLGIRRTYIKTNLLDKTKKILKNLKKLKTYGKKNTY